MPKISKKTPSSQTAPLIETHSTLKDIPEGTVFRFKDQDEAWAFENPGERFFLKITNIGPSQTGNCTVLSLDCKFAGLRNDDRLVIVHDEEIIVSESVKIPDPKFVPKEDPTEGRI